MSELEKLNNKKLSKTCQKFGTPNVRVTQTTRKVVIKRLEVAITNKQYSTGKNTNHRANARPYENEKKFYSNTSHTPAPYSTLYIDSGVNDTSPDLGFSTRLQL